MPANFTTHRLLAKGAESQLWVDAVEKVVDDLTKPFRRSILGVFVSLVVSFLAALASLTPRPTALGWTWTPLTLRRRMQLGCLAMAAR
jgi:hypothetical protein